MNPLPLPGIDAHPPKTTQNQKQKQEEKRLTRSLLDRDLLEELRLPTDGQLSLGLLRGNRVLRALAPLVRALFGTQAGEHTVLSLQRFLERWRKHRIERQAFLERKRATERRERLERMQRRESARRQRLLEKKKQAEARVRQEEEGKRAQEEERKKRAEERQRAEKKRLERLEEERTRRIKDRRERWQRFQGFFQKQKEGWQAYCERKRKERLEREEKKRQRGEEALRVRGERKQKLEAQKRARKEEKQKLLALRGAERTEQARVREERRRAFYAKFFGASQQSASKQQNEEQKVKEEERLVESAKKEAMRQVLIEQEKQKLLQGEHARGLEEREQALADERRKLEEERTALEAERRKIAEAPKEQAGRAPAIDPAIVEALRRELAASEAEREQLKKETKTKVREQPPGGEGAKVALEKQLAMERATLDLERERIRTDALAEAERRFAAEREALKAAAGAPRVGEAKSDVLVDELRKQLAASEAKFAFERDHIRAEALAEAEGKIHAEVAAGKGRGKASTQSAALAEELAKWKGQVEKLEQERQEIEQRRALQEEQERARKEQQRLEEERLELTRQHLAKERVALEEGKAHTIHVREAQEQLREEEEELEQQKRIAKAQTAAPAPAEKRPAAAKKTPKEGEKAPAAPKEEKGSQPALDIGHILLAQNYIDEKELKDAQVRSKERNVPLDHILREEGLVTKELLQNAIAEYYKIPFIDLRSQPPDPGVLELLPQSFSVTFNAVAVQRREDGSLLIATSSPERPNLLGEIRKVVPAIPHISFAYTSRESIEAALSFYRKPLETRFRAIMEERKKVAPEIIEEIFNDAVELGASDIHFEPQEQVIIVRFRVDGVMHEAGRIPKEYYEGIVNRTKIAGNMRIDEHFSAQDGAIRWKSRDGKAMDIRVSIVPIVDGEKIVLRLLSEYVRTLTLSDLGFTREQRELLIEASNKPFGMLLTTGPTGSGKSTTLYGLMKICNTPDVNISTIEDPVEYKIPGINHIQVNTKTDLTFERGLRALVRQDPDIILVGEIRDNITAQISVNAALTGHLLFSTLHANDAATAIPRLLEMQVEPYLLASTLELVIAQRLMRLICLQCRYSYTIPREEACTLFLRAERYFGAEEHRVTLYRGKGCPACGGTGYRGRIGLYEILTITPAIEEMIVQHRTTAEINTVARQEGMATLFEDGLLKVKAGQSTMEELLRVAAPPDPLPDLPAPPSRPRS